MGDVAKALGVGPELEFEGQTYRVAPLTFELRARFETWVERRAVGTVQKLKNALSDEDYQRAMTAVSREIATGVYSVGGEACAQAAKSLPGLKELLRLSLSKNHAEVDAAFIDRLVESKAELANEALAAANADPLPTTPPATASGATDSPSATSARSSATSPST